MNVVAEHAPMAEHRNCARHVFINWKKSNKGLILKELFWKCVKSTYHVEFNANLDELKAKDEKAYQDFIGKDITKFCKVFINPDSVSDMILNNTNETFNGYILNAKGKHCIHMLEEIRTSLMVRQHRKKMEVRGYTHLICPRIMEKVEKLKHYSRYCVPYAASDVMFEVENYGDRFIVDVQARTCSCRSWDITGIPCIHACSAINLMCKDAADFCHKAYSMDKYLECYKHGLPPLNGEKMWPRAEGLPIISPPVKKMSGRPKKKRKRNPKENPDKKHKLRKTGVQIRCHNCNQLGHNQRSCNNPTVSKPNPQQGRRGRPRKVPNEAEGSRASTSATNTSTTNASRARKSVNSTKETQARSSLTASGSAVAKTTIFIPPKPSSGSAAASSRNKGKKKKIISTQESCN